MTLLSDGLRAFKENNLKSEPKLVHYIATSKGYLPLENPTWSNEIECPSCGEREHGLYCVDKGKYAWICHRVCKGSKLPNSVHGGSTPPRQLRAVVWHKFCEINSLGDLDYDTKFEDIKQNKEKLDYMLKFCSCPRGIILMQGEPGTGKTYAALAMCELFTRTSPSAIFTTQKQMSNEWLNTFKEDIAGNYIDRISSVSLLVIDDFGIGEPNPKFLEFFMDVINTRLKWSNRGTVITTNLEPATFARFCGDALSDRINTGQLFKFLGGTRRKKTVL